MYKAQGIFRVPKSLSTKAWLQGLPGYSLPNPSPSTTLFLLV